MKRWLVKFAFLVLAVSALEADPLRIVSIGGTVTEIIYALGAQKDLIGVDTSSIYPLAATKLPQVGYQRNLSLEGVLSLRPSLILASEEAGPPWVVEQLKCSGIPWTMIPAENSIEGAKIKIRAVAHALHLESQGEVLVRHVEEGAQKARAVQVSLPERKKVIFIFAHGGGSLLVAGRKTAANAMIALAGGTNAICDYDGYKPLTAEAILIAQPDVILISKQGLQSIGGMKNLFNQPGLADTPAGKSGHVVALDELLLLGFGPRLGEALQQLTARL